MKKDEKEGFPKENLKPIVWPVGQPYGKGYQEGTEKKA